MFDTFERVTDIHGRKQLQCNKCRRQTIHTLEAQCVGRWGEYYGKGYSIEGATEFSLYRCGACDGVCYEKSSWNSEDTEHDEDGSTYAVREDEQYPPPSSADFSFDTDFTPVELNELIEEMIYALTGSKLKLATVALRMVVEFIVTDKKCTGRNLQKKIVDLQAKAEIDDAQLELLQKIREKGNAGAHERIPMNRNEMVAGIGIINLLLEKLYNGPARHAEVMKKASKAFKG